MSVRVGLPASDVAPDALNRNKKTPADFGADAVSRTSKMARLEKRLLCDKTVAYIGAPFNDGQELKGVDEGPKALRDAGLRAYTMKMGFAFEDWGDINPHAPSRYTTVESSTSLKGDSDDSMEGEGEGEAHGSGESAVYYTNVKNSREVGRACKKIHDATQHAAAEKKFVLTIGGDHSIAAGSIAGLLTERPDLAIIWVDAHGDCNTPETTPSGNYHGMPAAHLLGWFKKLVPGFEWMQKVPTLPENRIAFVGLRDLDPAEKDMMMHSGVHCFTMQDVDRYGISKVMDMALSKIDPEGRRPLHLSLDVDACDPAVAPGTGTKARGGLTYREVHYICEAMAETSRLTSMDLVEINPLIDTPSEDLHGDDPDIKGTQTVRLGVELIASALGKTIM
ncbi:unnamed protein product [Vitrella brassicaformis CCMP3155]|uniref:Arginase n=1 Tax=Vitrella brassicaformis (strain CCMP3155) TaxID=1169540 RepID=A0A0G4H848_VITBC|nr:unnamed protein product [Vitrella brassicaformis CCMP3155]|mmetsp:Transcript_29335/g.73075  ORF Transcript_29335/g.73075 Transcript_29335/m.73075 type:complete len:393 (-) Transcript_29335:1897-3075(-)|eukprot:CEM39982.1 unnamed protein product [Vitrella brassicaformis CCMP3155]